jgi:hypothetical protein
MLVLDYVCFLSVRMSPLSGRYVLVCTIALLGDSVMRFVGLLGMGFDGCYEDGGAWGVY